MAYDVIIVGAGSAGCVLASRLSENSGRSVLLLEAGPDFLYRECVPPDVLSSARPTFAHDWGYFSEPDERGRQIHFVRGKLVGGCSAINACIALRGPATDYDSWRARGNPGWSFNEVLPFFRKLEDDQDFTARWHGKGGPLPIRRYSLKELTTLQTAFLETCNDSNLAQVVDYNSPDAIGAGRIPMNQVGGIRESTALTYLELARDRANLTVRSRASVDRVIFENRRATGVVLTGTKEVIQGATVILSAGAYGSPAILMRSGIGDAELLRDKGIILLADLPGVGQNLIDHPAFALRYASILELKTDEVIPTFQTLLTLKSTPSVKGWDIMIKPTSLHPAKPPFENGTSYTIFVSLSKPRSRGWVKIRSADPDAPPVINPAFFSDPDDMTPMLEAVRTARRLANIPPIAELALREITPGPEVTGTTRLEAAIRERYDTFHHPVGTCRMGPVTDNDAVVNARGRVYGFKRLYVIDASIMPEIPAAPTNIPTIMLAERCADWLKGE